MIKFELSKFDFDAIQFAFDTALLNPTMKRYDNGRIERLKDQFAKAHTAWLETEEE